MGYRSDVAYTIRFIPTEDDFVASHRIKAKESFYTFLAEAKSKPETALCFQEEESINTKEPNGEGFYVDKENMTIKFFACHVKWYPDYSDVKCHEALMELASDWADDADDANNEYIGYVFVRIGESADDTIEECVGTGDYDWLGVRRQIVGDWLTGDCI